MELTKLQPTERIVEIKHPGTHEGLDIKVSIMSLDDPRMKAVKRKVIDNNLRLQQKGKFLKSSEAEENEKALVFSAMTGWTWGQEASFNKEKPAFTREKVFEVFDELPWFKQQIQEAISDEESFFVK